MNKVLPWIVVLLISCNTPDQNNKVKLIKVKEIELNPHELVFGNPSIVKLIESDSGKYLFLYNHLVKRFQFLNFPDGNIIREVPLDFEGPDGVGGLSGGTLTGKDSIWITFSSPAIGLINFDGKVLLKKKVENTTIPITFLTSDLQRPLIQSKHKIFGLQPYFMNHHGMDPKDIEKHQLLYSYDFEKDQIDWYDVFYPDDYWRNGKKMSDLTWTQRGNKLYLASIYDHQIQVFDISSLKVIETKEVRSRYIRRFDYVNEIPSGVNQGLINRLTFDKYAVLIYDPFRDVFYRFFHPGFELDDEESVEVLRTLNWSRPTMGVMILDKDLNILGEHLFEKNEVYTFSNYFIGEDGLYLSANNHFQRDYTDDVFRYVLFNLVDDEQIN